MNQKPNHRKGAADEGKKAVIYLPNTGFIELKIQKEKKRTLVILCVCFSIEASFFPTLAFAPVM
jgi:hypothetical protein